MTGKSKFPNSPGRQQAARDTGAVTRTLRRWLEDPSFRNRIEALERQNREYRRREKMGTVWSPHNLLALLQIMGLINQTT